MTATIGCELAGVAHIPTSLLPLKLAGLRPAEEAEQNYAESGPVLRSLVEHLRAGRALPPSTTIQGGVRRLDKPLFSSTSWGTNGNLVFVIRAGEDANALGGVRLPHLRTAPPGGGSVGAPLGAYRGTHCNNDPVDPAFILDCGLSDDANIYNMAGGSFTPYTAFAAQRCGDYYPSRQAYDDAVRAAVDNAVSHGWVLAEERDALVAAAEGKAAEFPGCVPEG